MHAEQRVDSVDVHAFPVVAEHDRATAVPGWNLISTGAILHEVLGIDAARCAHADDRQFRTQRREQWGLACKTLVNDLAMRAMHQSVRFDDPLVKLARKWGFLHRHRHRDLTAVVRCDHAENYRVAIASNGNGHMSTPATVYAGKTTGEPR